MKLVLYMHNTLESHKTWSYIHKHLPVHPLLLRNNRNSKKNTRACESSFVKVCAPNAQILLDRNFATFLLLLHKWIFHLSLSLSLSLTLCLAQNFKKKRLSTRDKNSKNSKKNGSRSQHTSQPHSFTVSSQLYTHSET